MLTDNANHDERRRRHQEITLWTQTELHAARHLCGKASFVRVREEPHDSFGRDDLVTETWELTL